MANLDITYSELEAVASALDSGQSSMEQTLLFLQKQVDGLIGAGFQTDQASGQFEISYKELNDGITKAVKALEGMSAFLRKTSQAYSSTDSQLAAAIRG